MKDVLRLVPVYDYKRTDNSSGCYPYIELRTEVLS